MRAKRVKCTLSQVSLRIDCSSSSTRTRITCESVEEFWNGVMQFQKPNYARKDEIRLQLTLSSWLLWIHCHPCNRHCHWFETHFLSPMCRLLRLSSVAVRLSMVPVVEEPRTPAEYQESQEGSEAAEVVGWPLNRMLWWMRETWMRSGGKWWG